MSPEKSRERRWFAYLLGNSISEEAEEVEREMAESPKEAEAFQNAFELAGRWARSAEAGQPVDLEALTSRLEGAGYGEEYPVSYWQRLRRLPFQAGPWAAAALLILALSQVSFSFSIGDATFAWGLEAMEDQAGANEFASSSVEDRLSAVERLAVEHDELLEAVAYGTLTLERDLNDTVAHLLRNQQVEAHTRRQDMERLWLLSGADTRGGAVWETGAVVPTVYRER